MPPNLSVSGNRTAMRRTLTARSGYRITLLSVSGQTATLPPVELVNGATSTKAPSHGGTVRYVISGRVQNAGHDDAAWIAFGPLVVDGRYFLPNSADETQATAVDQKKGHIGEPVDAIIPPGQSRAFTLAYTIPAELGGQILLLWPKASSPPSFRAVFELPRVSASRHS